MKYFKVCVTCVKDYEIDANPQTEQEWKNIQSQVGKKGGLCATCTNINYYDDGCMELKAIAEKHNAVISFCSNDEIEVQCPSENLAALAQDILYGKNRIDAREARHIAKIRNFAKIYGIQVK